MERPHRDRRYGRKTESLNTFHAAVIWARLRQSEGSASAFYRGGDSRNFLRKNVVFTRNNAYLKYAQLKK
jgi:hypothetical protein